jgi:outer membrane protein OmpA-like peptidoglycan-associated protein
MNTNKPILILAIVGIISGCAAIAPKELVDAREDNRRARTGTAARVSPAEVHVADEALQKAEASFNDKGDTYQTRDLAYVAQRKAQLAEATAAISQQRKSQARSKAEFATTQGEIVEQTKEDLAASEASGDVKSAQLSAAQKAKADADRRAADALAKLAAVKSDDRGTIITLSGSVLFASNQATLLPEARVRLEQVADVLLENPDRRLTIEGHTDSQGSSSFNVGLSQRRADAVRGALVSKGYPSELIQTSGVGEARPVGDNKGTEGRANNRRVEIIVARQ